MFQSNWSLKHFNLYLLALNGLNFTTDSQFEGFTIVLSGSVPGLRKNGCIHLNCGQVYEQWLNVIQNLTHTKIKTRLKILFVLVQKILDSSKKNAKLLDEIREMEADLSLLLKQIKICDIIEQASIENLSDDDSTLSLASYYHQILNSILKNLRSSFKPISSLKDDSFSNLQLTILK